jgi:DNA-binding response OmpR family regulator
VASRRKVLVVEDDRDIALLVGTHLEDIGCVVSSAVSGEDALELLEDGAFDLVVLDLMLPGIDGFEVTRRLRAAPGYTLVLMLTAKSSELDRVLGLELGADDYLAKPFSLRELQARVKALFRRKEALEDQSAASPSTLSAGDLTIDVERRLVLVAGNEVNLTAKEFDLLVQFARHPGRVYTRGQLLDLVWGYGYDGYEHTVNTHINRLRAKVEQDPSDPRYIETVWGVGYRFTTKGA